MNLTRRYRLHLISPWKEAALNLASLIWTFWKIGIIFYWMLMMLAVRGPSAPTRTRTTRREGENEEEIKMRKRKMKSVRAEWRGRTAGNHRRSLAARCLPGQFVPDSLGMIGVTSSGGWGSGEGGLEGCGGEGWLRRAEKKNCSLQTERMIGSPRSLCRKQLFFFFLVGTCESPILVQNALLQLFRQSISEDETEMRKEIRKGHFVSFVCWPNWLQGVC